MNGKVRRKGEWRSAKCGCATPKVLRRALLHAAACGDGDGLRQVCRCIGKNQILDSLPDAVCAVLVEVLRDPAVWAMDDSSALLFLFESNFEVLTLSQRAQLLAAIAESYTHMRSWMSCFYISSILGEGYCNRASYELLRCFARKGNAMQRSFVPHGLEHVIKSTSDASLRDDCMGLLQNMKRDRSKRVRYEVASSLQQLKDTKE